MAKEKQLNPIRVNQLSDPGMYLDGLGLWLQISKWKTKSWIYRFTMNGRTRSMGLGATHTISLAEARTEAKRCRQLVREGLDPIEERRRRLQENILDAAKALTFRQCAEAYIEAHRAGWSNPKHASQWTNTLETYCGPVFGDLPVSEIDTGLVLKAIEPIWASRTETASRVRGRIENVLSWAKVRGYRQGENPARWRGHLDHLLPKRSKVAKVKHHPALPYKELPDFITALHAEEGIAAAALEFVILTACRTSEAIMSRWEEIDGDMWIIPPERTKSGREHRIPLSPRASSILQAMRDHHSEWIFPGQRRGRHLSNTSLLAVLKRMDRADLTVHGFRSTFRDWAAETTNYPHEMAEMALAHVISNKAEAAYRRGDMLKKRRALMDEWEHFAEGVVA